MIKENWGGGEKALKGKQVSRQAGKQASRQAYKQAFKHHHFFPSLPVESIVQLVADVKGHLMQTLSSSQGSPLEDRPLSDQYHP